MALCLLMFAVALGGMAAGTAWPAFGFSADSALGSRVRKAPPALIAKLEKADARGTYSAYQPTTAEMKLIADCLEKLPPLTMRMLRQRLLGIYFVTGFARGGATGWELDAHGTPFFYLLFNPQVLRFSLSDYLSFQQLTLFAPGDPWADITIDCGNTLPALLYLLLRESTHVVDVATGLTPYSPAGLPPVTQPKLASFSTGVWLSAEAPAPAFDFAGRTTLNYSGVESHTPLSFDKARTIFTHLQQTPFASLSACRSAADDLAEFVTFYHLTQKLGAPYRVTMHRDFPGEVAVWLNYEPMKLPQVQQRFAAVALFYREEK